MYEYISGEITDISPSHVVTDCSGVGYFINISLYTYELVKQLKTAKFFIHQVLREDTNELYGFYEKSERELFRHLISVSGIGSNTARLMLSFLKPIDIIKAISEADVQTIKSIKGIGQKTAERVIVDLRDKVGKISTSDSLSIIDNAQNSKVEEAVSALVMLGFNKKIAEKTASNIQKTNKDFTIEQLVKLCIQNMSS
jgi:Holliday junction DNA helicase RuvA